MLLLILVSSSSALAQLETTRKVPLGCLMVSGCFENAQGIEQSSNAVSASLGVILQTKDPVHLTSSSDPVDAGIDLAEARALAAEVLASAAAEPLDPPAQTPGRGILPSRPDTFLNSVQDYTRTPEYRECIATFRALREIPSKVTDSTVRAKVAWLVYQEYLTRCNRGRAEDLVQVNERLVLLFRTNRNRNPSGYCMGFNYFRNYVLTARHCLVDPDEISLMTSRYKRSDPHAWLSANKPQAGSRAVLLGEPNKSYAVDFANDIVQATRFFPFEPDRDISVLKIVGRPDAISQFPQSEPTAWLPVRIPGILISDSALGEALTSSEERARQIVVSATVVDISPICTLSYRVSGDSPFLFHSCQTRFGYSGAPIFEQREHRLALVGVHTGTVRRTFSEEQWPYPLLLPNYGLRTDEFMKKTVQP